MQMGPANLMSLVILALVFILWAVTMFRTLWRLGRRALKPSDPRQKGVFGWVERSLRVYGDFLTSDKDRPDRRLILLLTLLLVLILAGRIYLITRVS